MFHIPIVAKFKPVFFSTTKECMLLLKTHRHVSAATDLGSMSVWLYDDTHENRKPVYRAYRSVHCVIRAEIETDSLTTLRSFVATQLRVMNGRANS